MSSFFEQQLSRTYSKPSHKNNNDKCICANKKVLETIDSTVKFSFNIVWFDPEDKLYQSLKNK